MKRGFPKPTPHTTNRGISANRKDNLLSMLRPLLQKNRIKFWEDLHIMSMSTTSLVATEDDENDSN